MQSMLSQYTLFT